MSTGTQSTPEVNISPKKIRAKKGTFQVTIPNREKQAHSYQLKASDPEGMCNYKFDKENITVAPGSTETITLTVAFKKVHLTGTSKVCNFTVAATGTAGEIKTAAGQLECPAILPLWVLLFGALTVVAVIAVVVIMLANGGKEESPGLTTNTTKTATSATTQQPTTLTTSTSALVTPTTTHTTTAQISATTTTAVSTTTTTATTTASTSAATTTTTSSANTPPDLNGSWNFTITVTQANGVCAGESGTSTKTMTITQKGQDITIAGFLGSPANKLTGTIGLESGIWVINVSGSYGEDGGTTTSSHRLEVKSTSEISGTEDWSWSGGGGTCPGGKATVTATRA